MISFDTRKSHVTVDVMEPHKFGAQCTICGLPAVRHLMLGDTFGNNSRYEFCRDHAQSLVDQMTGRITAPIK
jgi:hypothetical protein